MRPSPDIRRRLTAIGKLAPVDVALTKTALILAAAERPAINPVPYYRHLERLAEEVDAYAGDGDLAMRAEALRSVIARRYGYAGADDAYEDSENANLMRVIDRRQGLPALLAIIYIHVARALGWTMDGLDFPPRMLVRLDGDGERLILDPFDGAIELGPRQLRDMLKAVAGPHVELAPEHTRAMDNRQILVRSRRNVKILHLRADRLDEALEAIEAVLLFAPTEAPLWRESGILNARADRVSEAVTALEVYLRHAGGDPSRYRATLLLQELRQRLI